MFWNTQLYRKIISRLRIELYTIFFYIWLFPIIFFQIIILIRFPSIAALVILIEGIIANVLFNNILAGFDSFMRLSQLFKGFIEKFSECTYIQYNIENYLDRDALEQANEYSFGHLSRSFGWRFMPEKLEENIHILVVKKSPLNVVPKQLTTYSMPFDKAYIFVRDEPERIKGVGKFFIYHEIGHTLYTAARHKIRILYSNKTFLFFLFWSLWFVDWHYQSFLIAIAFVLTSITMLREWNRRINKSNLEDEMWADIFAISSLPDKDRIRVARYFSRYPFPPDSRMDEQQNTLRVKNLTFNLEEASKDDVEPHNNIPRLFSFENISDIYAPLDIVTASILAMTLATFAQEPTMGFLSKTFFWIDLPLFVILILIAFISIYLKYTINQVLNIEDK